MRILFLSHYFPPEGNAPASRTYALCRRWVALGHQVCVITCTPNAPSGIVYPGYRNRPCQRELVDGIQVVRPWVYLAANRGTWRRILNYISYMLSATFVALCVRYRPDVVIATSPQFFCAWAGVFVSRLRRRPLIVEIRDIWPESIVAVGAMGNRRILRLLEWLERRMYAAATHIVTVGEGYRERLIERGVPAERISVIPNGVDRELFWPRASNDRLRSDLGLTNAFVCAYVGTIGMAAGLSVVLRAARILKERGRDDIKFLLIGDGARRDELEQEATAGNLTNIVFTGRQNKDRIPDFLSVADSCLVHLRKAKTFRSVLPSKIFEAAAMAKPIILGVQGYAERLVSEFGAGLCIEPDNGSALADAVEALADDRELCAALGRSGHENIVHRFDRDRLAVEYLDIITGVFGGAAADRLPAVDGKSELQESVTWITAPHQSR